MTPASCRSANLYVCAAGVRAFSGLVYPQFGVVVRIVINIVVFGRIGLVLLRMDGRRPSVAI
jgi:hypothetical protein